MNLTAGLGSFDPNTLPMDAFELSGSAASIERYISLKAPWMFGQRKKFLDETTYTVEAGVTYILVTIPDAVTITIPAGLPLLRDLTIARSVASMNAITAVPSGSETIEGAASFVTHGAWVVSTPNEAEITLRKKKATGWNFVNGVVSGSNSNGYYEKHPTGKLKQWGKKISSVNGTPGYFTGLAYYNSASVTFPVAFTSLEYISGGIPDNVVLSDAVAGGSSNVTNSDGVFTIYTSASGNHYMFWMVEGGWK